MSECFHPSVYIREEMDAREWTRDDLALAMGGDFGINRLALDLYLALGPRNPSLRIGKEGAELYAKAFDVDAQFFLSLERIWLDCIVKSASRELGEQP